MVVIWGFFGSLVSPFDKNKTATDSYFPFAETEV